MTWSINIHGHGEEPVSGSCYYPEGKSASYSGTLEEVAEQSVAFIRACQQEERDAQAPEAEPES